MTEFIPPFPKRHEKSLGPLNLLKHAHSDLLSIWTLKNFQSQFIETKLINRPVFIANCPDVVEHIFVTNQANYEKKNPLLRKALAPLLGDEIVIGNGQIKQTHINLEAPFFSLEHIDSLVKSIEGGVQRWENVKPGTEINVLPEMSTLTAEIICRILFGNQVTTEQAEQVAASFAAYQAAIEKLDITAFLDLPDWFPGMSQSRTTEAAKNVQQVIDNLIELGIKSNDPDSLLAHLLTLSDGEPLEKAQISKQIRNELILLFIAGHETATSILTWAWYLISQCPDVEQKLHEEVDSVLGSESATFDDFNSLVFTRAIIAETLRLYPPIPILSREASSADTIRNRTIPAKSIMLVVPWLLHRHTLYWDKPDHFMPERFLDGSVETNNEFSYLPFRGSPKEDAAEFFGTIVTSLCLAVLAKRFRLAAPQGQVVEHECRLTLRPKGTVPMQLIAR